MARRTRKRTGNDGGGFPLGQILALAMGGGEANPDFEAAQAAQAGGNQGPLTAGQDQALKTGPYRPSNVFQKFYGMDYGDAANEDYRLGKIKAEEALQRQLGAAPQIAAAETDAKIASGKKLRRAEAERLAPSIPLMAGQGQLPDLGMPAPIDPRTPAGSMAYAEEILRRTGPDGLYAILRQGESDLLKSTEDRAQQPRAAEAARTDQVARISKGKLSTTQDEIDRAVLDVHRDDYIKGRQGQMIREKYLGVGPIAYDVTDPQNFLSYIMPGDGLTTPTPPQPFAVRDGMAIFPTDAKPAPAPAPAPAKPAPSAAKPMSGSAPYVPPAFFRPGGTSRDMFGTKIPAPPMAPYKPTPLVIPQTPDASGAFGVPLQPSLTPALTPEALEQQRQLMIRRYLMER